MAINLYLNSWYIPFNEAPVRIDARLARVSELSKHTSLNGHFHLRVVENNERASPTQLERGLRKVPTASPRKHWPTRVDPVKLSLRTTASLLPRPSYSGS